MEGDLCHDPKKESLATCWKILEERADKKSRRNGMGRKNVLNTETMLDEEEEEEEETI
jgi:hypothetical protein